MTTEVGEVMILSGAEGLAERERSRAAEPNPALIANSLLFAAAGEYSLDGRAKRTERVS
jgi:hypothetical protein